MENLKYGDKNDENQVKPQKQKLNQQKYVTAFKNYLQNSNTPKHNEFEFAKPGFGFVDRYEKKPRYQKIILNEQKENILTLAEYEAKNGIQQVPKKMEPVVKRKGGKNKKIVIELGHFGFLGKQ